MVDHRVEAVRPPGKDHPVFTLLFQHHQGVFTPVVDLLVEVVQFLVASRKGITDLLLCYPQVLETFVEVFRR